MNLRTLAYVLVPVCVWAACTDETVRSLPAAPGATETSGGPPAPTALPTVQVPTADAAPEAGPGSSFRAGVSVRSITPQIGAPLGGYGSRRRLLPSVNPDSLTTLLAPSTGVRDALFCKALVLDDGKVRVALMAFDAVAMTGDFASQVVTRAASKGATIPQSRVMAFASHTHSGSGALTKLHLWELAAMDRHKAKVVEPVVETCADALAEAERALEPARLGIGVSPLLGVTQNRRVGVSPSAKADSVDSDLSVLRLERANGSAMALLWNFAIHGTMLGASNTELSSDIMGSVNRRVEELTGVPVLFANAAEGDVSPKGSGESGLTNLTPTIANAVRDAFGKVIASDQIRLQTASEEVDFGAASLVLSTKNISTGELDLRPVALALGAAGAETLPLDASMVDHRFRYQALRINNDVIVAIPGEPISELGMQIKADGASLGFGRTLVFGLANGHMGYVTTEAEYEAGGYESMITLFGKSTGARLRAAARARMQEVLRP
jgi:neutral ceramidase